MSADTKRMKEILELELWEIDNALRLLDKNGDRRLFIQLSGGMMIEVSLGEAREFLEERRAKLLAILSKL